MHIAIIAPNPFVPIPPVASAPLESVVAALAQGLVDRGHRVTLFGSRESTVPCDRRYMDEGFFSSFPHTNPSLLQGRALMPIYWSWAAQEALRCGADAIHVHESRILYNMFFGSVPQVCTVHWGHYFPDGATEEAMAADFDGLRVAVEMCNGFPRVDWVMLSERHRSTFLDWYEQVFPPPGTSHVVPNGIDLREFPFQAVKGDYVVCLSRLSEEKGLHLAIESASKAGVPIKIAGPRTLPGVSRPGLTMMPDYEKRLFEIIEREPLAEYVGEVSGAARAELLANARALLFPIQWEEPFGLTLIESMACGTPVIAFRRGAVPEVLVDGVTGYVVDDVDAMAERISVLDRLRPMDAREHVAGRFSMDAMAAGYEAVYERAIARA